MSEGDPAGKGSSGAAGDAAGAKTGTAGSFAGLAEADALHLVLEGTSPTGHSWTCSASASATATTATCP